MRIHRSQLGDFVGGAFALPENPVLRGMGDFVDGKFALPENVVMRGQMGVGMGSLLPSAPMYPIPQNSVITAWREAGMSGVGCGCGCNGADDGCGKGMGQVTFSSITAPFTTAFTDLSTAISTQSIAPLTTEDMIILALTGYAAYAVFGGSKRR